MDEYGTNAYDYDYGYDSYDNHDSYEEPSYDSYEDPAYDYGYDDHYDTGYDSYEEPSGHGMYMNGEWDDGLEGPNEQPHGWGWAHEANEAPAW